MEVIMQIEIWFDFSCPFCYIGKTRFEKALNKFKHKDQVKVIYRSYLLNPLFDNQDNLNIYEYLALEKSTTVEEAKKLFELPKKMAEQTGLIYNLDQMIPANSRLAHMMVKLCEDFEIQSALINDIYAAHFTNGLDISKLEVLTDLVSKYGFNSEEIENLIEIKAIKNKVNHDLDLASSFGIQAVPGFVINREYLVNGAQNEAYFLQMLEQVYREEKVKDKVKKEASYCVGDQCYNPKIKV
jgi:predicted DsbA family dithiol-disulfide isomerase